ncbi:MAG TPA: pyrroloquinoline quinone biosynthesis peptide chaperone PqqD, partial [Methylocystis sp.]|nr:pyrroloquinoline quinone biosynthesis peptide chaperone PqqD [Methylocystis sp.]
MSQKSSRYAIDASSRPAFERWARLHHDRARSRSVVLAPERAYEIDAISFAVLREIDGVKTVGEIAQELSARYGAPQDVVSRDVAALLQGLSDKRLLREGPSPFSAPPASPRAQ